MTNPSPATITFLCIDVQDQAQSAPASSADHYHTILQQAITACGGTIFKAGGDMVYAVFATAPVALAAALAAYWTLHTQSWGAAFTPRVRMALHTGPAGRYSTIFVGPTFNHAVSLLAACRGGQVLLSRATYDLIGDHIPAGTELRDLGEHRLKDLTRPEHIFQLVPHHQPADLALVTKPAPFPVNLPVLPSPLIGRDREVAEIRGILRRPDVRLLTLLGSSGTGKTRLSLQVAVDLVGEFDDGVYFVPLAPVASPDLVASAIAQSLDIKEAGDRPLVEALRAHLGERHLLLILDNFEQLLAASPLIDGLLKAAPRLQILVTSQVGLGIPDEQVFPVPPLALPDPARLPPLDQLAHYPSIALFLVRAQVVQPDFALTRENAATVTRLCIALGGIPLAIELVAAYSNLFAPEQMLDQIAQRLAAERARTSAELNHWQVLREALAWSYTLLGANEQALLARMGVFEGGCTIEAAEAVASELGIENEELKKTHHEQDFLNSQFSILNSIQSLLDKNLLLQEQWSSNESRYMMLDMIHQFALARLSERGENELLRRSHGAYFLALAERAEAELTGADQETWLKRLEDDLHNLRATLQWSIVQGAPATAVRLSGSLWRFWYMHGHLSEGRRWLNQALAAATAREPLMPPALRTKALTGASVLSFVQGDHAKARSFAEQNLGLFRLIGDKRGVANTLSNLGAMAVEHGDYAEAQPLLTESLELRREIGDTWGIAATLNNLARAIEGAGDAARAETLYAESLALLQELADKGSIANATANLGRLVLARGDTERARQLFKSSLMVSQELGYIEGIASALEGFAHLVALEGRPAQAAQLVGVIDQLHKQSDIQLALNERAKYDRIIDLIRGLIDDTTYAAAWGAGYALPVDLAISSILEEPSMHPTV